MHSRTIVSQFFRMKKVFTGQHFHRMAFAEEEAGAAMNEKMLAAPCSGHLDSNGLNYRSRDPTEAEAIAASK